MATPAPAAAAAAAAAPLYLLCGNCDSLPVYYTCPTCKQHLCVECDAALHEPIKKRTHVRKFHYNDDFALMLPRVLKDGRRSDFSAQKADGAAIVKSVLEDDRGYWYAYENSSTGVTLDAELNFKLVNFSIANFPSATSLRLVLPPASSLLFRLVRERAGEPSDCNITQRFAIAPSKAGEKASISVPVKYDHYTSIDVLKSVTEAEGQLTDYGKLNPMAAGITQHQWETHGMFCFFFKNASADVLFHREFVFELHNVSISGRAAGENKVAFDLSPGQTEFIVLREINPAEAYSMNAKSSYYVKKI